MRNSKKESVLSLRSIEAPRLLALAALLATLAGCGTSAPRPERSRNDDSTVALPAGGEAVARLEGTPLPPVEVPERAAALHSRALDAMRSGNWTAAQTELEQLIAEFPAFPGPYVNLAIALREDARADEAESALEQALTLAPNHPAANNELGMLARKRGEFAEAEAAYRRAIESDPAYALAHYNLGVLLDLYLRREAEALEEYEAYQALVPAPDEEVSRWVVDLRRRLGMTDETARVAREVGP
jgi:tetratricopeptide (TPR) repeat protein